MKEKTFWIIFKSYFNGEEIIDYDFNLFIGTLEEAEFERENRQENLPEYDKEDLGCETNWVIQEFNSITFGKSFKELESLFEL
jgi:hypothetical protein